MGRLAASTGCLKTLPIAPVCEILGQLGLSPVEVNPWRHMAEEETADDIIAALAAGRLAASAVLGGWCDFFVAGEAAEATFARVARQILLARKLGATRIRLFYGRLPAEYLTPDLHARAVANLRRVAESAPDILFTLENHDGVNADPTWCARALADADRTNLRATFDPVNFLRAGFDPFTAWPILADKVANLHLKDIRQGRIVGIGEGEFNWPRFLDRLAADGYTGSFTVEYESDGPPVFGLYASMAAARRLLSRFKD